MEARNNTDFFFFVGNANNLKWKQLFEMKANKNLNGFFLMHNDMHEIHYNEIKLCKQI